MTIMANPARDVAEPEPKFATLPDKPPPEPSGPDRDAGAGPGPTEFLHSDEYTSDVVFLAGLGGDTWRYPAHRRKLADVGPVFAQLLRSKDDVIVVDFVDRRGFEALLRFVYCDAVQMSCVATARCALDAAYKFMHPPFAEVCARRIDELLTAGAALEILRDLRFLCAHLPGAASAPPLPALASDAAAERLALCSRWCDSIAHNALLVLDEAADEALADERLEELPWEDLALFVKRETLRLSSELALAEALFRWSVAACRRTRAELTPSNRRKALGELAYCPRYLLLRGAELERALALDLLDASERALVWARASGVAPAPPVTSEQEAMLRRFARPRSREPRCLPVNLSPRSAPPPRPRPGLCARIRRSKKRSPEFDPTTEKREDESGCCACFGDGLLRAFICLFD